MTFIHLLDIFLATIVLRVALGWLFSYPRLVRLILMLMALITLGALVQWTQLPFSGILFWILIAPISLIVLLSFLPELGKIYQSASRGYFFGNFRTRSESLVPILASTLEELNRRNYGALIVLPANKDIEDCIHGGEEVDAKINQSLLVSLFHPASPRHDGAAIIIKDRLIQVGAFLPLASSEATTENLGTRHLAAQGVTQISDSYAFVVSEERRVISYAHDGKLTSLPSTNEEGLEQAIKNIFGKKEGLGTSQLLPYLSLALWIGSLLVAVICTLNIDRWKAQFVDSSAVVTSVTARVELSSIPKGLFVEDLKPKEVTLFLRSPQIFKPIGGMTILVDLKESSAGKYTLNLSERLVEGLPRDARIERFDPPSIFYTVAEAKQLKIKLEKPEMINLLKALKVVDIKSELTSFKAEVRDTKWKLTSTIKPQNVDLSAITKPGIYRLPFTLNLPPTIEPLTDLEPALFLTVEIK